MAAIDLILPNRDDLVSDFTDAWRARAAAATPPRTVDVSEGSLPHQAGQVTADMTLPLFANHDKIARAMVVRGKTGAALEEYARERLQPNDDGSIRLPATGGSGYFEVGKIAAGGAFIAAGTVLLYPAKNQSFQVLFEGTYQQGEPIQIEAINTGIETNLPADTPLLFDSPPGGCSPGGVVLPQNDGTGQLVGLSGGRGIETDTELQDRVIAAQTDPPAAGNSAEIVMEAQRTGGVPVQRAFAFPAWFGPGSTSVAFTLRPDASVTRIPNTTQRGLVDAQLRAKFPTDYSITVAAVLPQAFAVVLGVSWISGARSWVDLVPFPDYLPGDPVVVDGAVAIGNSAFRLTTGTATTAPQVGQTIALFDVINRRFQRKRIATVTEVIAGMSWDLTFSLALGVSDTFIPAAGALVSPYAPSMQRLVAPMLSYVRTLGPGEMFSVLPDPGGRKRRWPFSPDTSPSLITNNGLVGASLASGAVSDSEVLLPAVPYATTVGTPGVSVYLLQLSDFAAFPQT